jgi:1,4-alpha-glucan branching enzyme
LKLLHPDGVFAGTVSVTKQVPVRYRARRGDAEWAVTDPYSFGPVLGPMDDYYAREGSDLRLFDKMGAHWIKHEGAQGIHFAVWAPNAQRVSVVGDFNNWDGRRHVMRLRAGAGIWEIFAPDVPTALPTSSRSAARTACLLPLKADPFARRSELRPKTASVTAPELLQEWEDEAHLKHWAEIDKRRQPISIYEVHAGSWQRRNDGTFLSWDELASSLIPYCVDMGFTHIEFLPITEHPYDPSWGYQTTGLYAPTARFGEPEGFARFVNGAHKVGIGVILDWVPAHFPTDEHGLGWFDGTALYEHEDPAQGLPSRLEHGDLQFRPHRSRFLPRQQRALLVGEIPSRRPARRCRRLDALPRLFPQARRMDPERIWRQREPGSGPLPAEMNTRIYAEHPGVMTIAEESTSWPKVSQPVHEGGLGFGFKWNMGFMHDTLSYMSREPVHRKHHHNELTFGLLYAYSENFVLPLSHDEVVHGKGSLIAKMPGDDWQKFANLRAYYALHVGLSRQEAAVHGPGIRPVERVERGRLARLEPAAVPHARGHAPAGARSQLHLPQQGGDCMPATARAKASNG